MSYKFCLLADFIDEKADILYSRHIIISYIMYYVYDMNMFQLLSS